MWHRRQGYVYGAVTDAQGKRAAGVTVDVNGVKVETDAQGRYIAEGFLASVVQILPTRRGPQRNRTIVRAHDPGNGSVRGSFGRRNHGLCREYPEAASTSQCPPQADIADGQRYRDALQRRSRGWRSRDPGGRRRAAQRVVRHGVGYGQTG